MTHLDKSRAFQAQLLWSHPRSRWNRTTSLAEPNGCRFMTVTILSNYAGNPFRGIPCRNSHPLIVSHFTEKLPSDALCPSLPRLHDGLVVGGSGRRQPELGGTRRRRSALGFDVVSLCIGRLPVALPSRGPLKVAGPRHNSMGHPGGFGPAGCWAHSTC